MDALIGLGRLKRVPGCVRDRLVVLDTATGSPLPAFAALILLLVFLTLPFHWTGDEDNYLLLALRTVNPGRFGPWHAVFDQSRERIVAFWTMGQIVQAVGLENAHRALEAGSILLLAWGLARLTAWLGLSALDAVVATLLFWLCGETLMGGEWMIGGVEPKTIGHGCGLIAFAAAGRQRGIVSAIWCVAALYAHFLVGAYWLVASVGLALAVGRTREAVTIGAIAFLLALPLATLILIGQRHALATPQPAGMPSADYIYSVLRAPHHAAPFAPEGGWRMQALIGCVQAAVIGILALTVPRSADPRLRALARVVAVTAIFLILAMAASYVDRHGARLGKLYPFRPASPFLLLTIVAGLVAWRPLTADRPLVRLMPAGALAAAGLPMALLGWHIKQEPTLDPPTQEMVAAVRARAPQDAPVLLDPATDANTGIVRLLDRQTIVAWKFVPTNPAEIYRWWRLIEARRQAFAGRCDRIEPAAHFLVATAATLPEMQKCGPIIWSNRTYTLIRLR